MKLPLLVIFTLFICIGCSKPKDELTSECIQVRFVGKGCRDIIQVLTPVSSELLESWNKGSGSGSFENCIAVDELDSMYKNGQPFVIAVKDVHLVGLITDECTVPQHSITFSACQNTTTPSN